MPRRPLPQPDRHDLQLAHGQLLRKRAIGLDFAAAMSDPLARKALEATARRIARKREQRTRQIADVKALAAGDND